MISRTVVTVLLGFTLSTVAFSEGIVLKTLNKDSLLFKHGFRIGDVILAIDGKKIESHEDFVEALKKLKNKEHPVKAVVKRGDLSKTVEIAMEAKK